MELKVKEIKFPIFFYNGKWGTFIFGRFISVDEIIEWVKTKWKKYFKKECDFYENHSFGDLRGYVLMKCDNIEEVILWASYIKVKIYVDNEEREDFVQGIVALLPLE
jgi:hypothetical protein